MWNPKWIIDMPVAAKVLVLVAGFFILVGSCFISRTDDDTEEKTDDK